MARIMRRVMHAFHRGEANRVNQTEAEHKSDDGRLERLNFFGWQRERGKGVGLHQTLPAAPPAAP